MGSSPTQGANTLIVQWIGHAPSKRRIWVRLLVRVPSNLSGGKHMERFIDKRTNKLVTLVQKINDKVYMVRGRSGRYIVNAEDLQPVEISPKNNQKEVD